jgi:hypothetical protein
MEEMADAVQVRFSGIILSSTGGSMLGIKVIAAASASPIDDPSRVERKAQE